MFKPMLAATVTDPTKLTFPLLASPKLDGIRCLICGPAGARVLSRSLKPIPNKHVQSLFSNKLLENMDGELIVGNPAAKDVFNVTSSGVMSVEGEPDVRFYPFDMLINAPYYYRHKLLQGLSNHIQVNAVNQFHVEDLAELLKLETRFLQEGFEGIMLRRPDGLYKHGRSTLKEGYLMKLKRFVDGEAEVLGMTELVHNGNETKLNELGKKERSSKKINMTGMGTMGSLLVRDIKTGVEFELGTGFTEAQRAMFWGQLGGEIKLGSTVKYKSQLIGVKDKPRFPVYLGLRDKRDL